MSVVKSKVKSGIILIFTVVLLSTNLPHTAVADTPMTAGVVLEKMPSRELLVYISGIVEGLAYARFRKDSAASGQKDEAGMKCIYDWYYEDSATSVERIESAFMKYKEHYPSVLLATMIKQECGE